MLVSRIIPLDFNFALYNFHHIGYLTSSIDFEVQFFNSLGFERHGDCVIDFARGVDIQFLKDPMSGILIELICPFPEDRLSMLSQEVMKFRLSLIKLMNRRSGPYHLGFIVRKSTSAIEMPGLRCIIPKSPAIALGGREVAFYLSKTGSLIEMIYQK